ncbi:hypothetical protein [Duffyella gerundensis]|uniref:hypothetical protein n=1 Tax=Duffyella gerundensis TaxID=1619313 RepID=UPI0016544BBB|nr:hypothetical protein [Duffyella gerundensis]
MIYIDFIKTGMSVNEINGTGAKVNVPFFSQKNKRGRSHENDSILFAVAEKKR